MSVFEVVPAFITLHPEVVISGGKVKPVGGQDAPKYIPGR